MKYLKILIDLKLWHLIPYRIEYQKLSNNHLTEFGWLCLKIIITWKQE